jgi:hypothetical protein
MKVAQTNERKDEMSRIKEGIRHVVREEARSVVSEEL